MRVLLRDNRSAEIRLLNYADTASLYNYLQNLSPESRSRFAPHPFDRSTILSLFDPPDTSIQRYIATGYPGSSIIVAYMLIKQGMTEGDQDRYAQGHLYFDPASTVSFAPSVADDWQNSGLGTAMSASIETQLKTCHIRHIVLWGGVQASNTKAVNFYKKNGYRLVAPFHHEGKNNYDMVKEL